MGFSGFFCCYSVSHCSNKPTIKIIDWSFLCQWANIQNQGDQISSPPHCIMIHRWKREINNVSVISRIIPRISHILPYYSSLYVSPIKGEYNYFKDEFSKMSSSPNVLNIN